MSNPTGYETIARFRGGEVLASARRVVVIGTPDDATDANGDSLHNCDAMGCGQSHVVAIVDRPAPHYPPMPGTGAPRDPSRIEPILARLRAAWHRSPDLRLGQLIVGSIPIGHLDRADAIRRLFNAECHEFGAAGAPVEWPAPSTAIPANRFDCAKCGQAVKADEDGCCATCGRNCTIVFDDTQPPPVLDLDALDRAAKATSDRGVFVEDGAIYAYDGDVCFRVGSAENAAAEGDVAAAIVTTLDAAPHLIAEARAAVVLRQELAALRAHFDAAAPEHNLPALLDLYNDRTTEAREKLAEAKRLIVDMLPLLPHGRDVECIDEGDALADAKRRAAALEAL